MIINNITISVIMGALTVISLANVVGGYRSKKDKRGWGWIALAWLLFFIGLRINLV